MTFHQSEKNMAMMCSDSQSPERLQLLRRPEVLTRCGFSNSTLHRLIKNGDFPSPIPIGPRSVAWIEQEVNNWIEQQIMQSRGLGSEKK